LLDDDPRWDGLLEGMFLVHAKAVEEAERANRQ
jgi:hypothetical protein